MKEAALDYVESGFTILPLHYPVEGGGCSCGRADCPSIGKHPMTKSGVKDAFNDPGLVDFWWDNYPNANIGIATGNGLVVIDVDGEKGRESLSALLGEFGLTELPETRTALTGGGGVHYLFHCADPAIRNRAGIRPNIDVRANGGYIVAPPSLHRSGNRYQWELFHGFRDVPMAELPDWLYTLLVQPERPQSKAPATGTRVQEGNRNEHLFKLASSLRGRQGLTEAAIIAAVQEENKARCDPPLSEKEVETLCKSASRYEPGDPQEGGFAGFAGFAGDPLPPNPIFPAAELSDVLRNMAVSTGESLQVAVDMPAVALLTVVSLCAQKKFVINPKAGWIEPVNLYASIVALSSERKTAVMTVAMKPVYAFTREENERRRPAVEGYRTQKDMLERRIEAMKKAATSGTQKGAKPVTTGDITLLQQELADLERGAIDYITLISDDTTMEVLARNMEQNGEKMAVVSSEGGIFNILSGLYSGGIANIDIFLKAYSGDYYQSDRMTRGRVILAEPALTVLLMVQPSVLEAIMRNNDFKGRGLVARFLYALPESMVGHRSYDTGAIPEEFERAYHDLIKQLLSLPDGPPRILHLDTEAQDEARKLFLDLEPRLKDDLEPIGDWAGKHHGRVMRIAALLHICDHGAEAANILIPGETIRRARTIGEYFIDHAKRAYMIMGLSDDQATKDAKYILKRLDSTGATEISKRDLHDLCRDRVGLEKVGNMDPGLNVLVERGYIKIEKAPPAKPAKPAKGGRPSWMIYVNPEYTNRKDEKYGNYKG